MLNGSVQRDETLLHENADATPWDADVPIQRVRSSAGNVRVAVLVPCRKLDYHLIDHSSHAIHALRGLLGCPFLRQAAYFSAERHNSILRSHTDPHRIDSRFP